MQRQASEGGEHKPVAASVSGPPHASSADSSHGAPWAPSEEWLLSVKRAIPLRPTLLLIEYLEPLVERHVRDLSLAVDDAGVLEVCWRVCIPIIYRGTGIP